MGRRGATTGSTTGFQFDGNRNGVVVVIAGAALAGVVQPAVVAASLGKGVVVVISGLCSQPLVVSGAAPSFSGNGVVVVISTLVISLQPRLFWVQHHSFLGSDQQVPQQPKSASQSYLSGKGVEVLISPSLKGVVVAGGAGHAMPSFTQHQACFCSDQASQADLKSSEYWPHTNTTASMPSGQKWPVFAQHQALRRGSHSSTSASISAWQTNSGPYMSSRSHPT
mmetsp:Transcript_115148/g.365871  ORF Transcript_115148/g.365871 Transcript_115148/m.365871 type:complete len:224 (+) Transcript_115148:2017-2688(+)